MESYTKYWRSIAIIMTISGLLLFTLAARAAGRIVYEQAPGHSGAFLSAERETTIAEDFQFDQPTLISNIEWWGGYGSHTSFPSDDNFTVRLYADNGGTPGALLHTFIVGDDALRIATGDFVLPPLPEQYFEGVPEFEYSFSLPTAFLAQANTRYWLSIVNVLDSFEEDWSWEMSGSLLRPGVQRSFESVSWEPQSENASFLLQGAVVDTSKVVSADS
ncbi:MAG TPA: hypothetical protein VLE49_13660 [Anaerolineales bacterium]|nr:hypothetical protein [Anaerolineales bacterium]